MKNKKGVSLIVLIITIIVMIILAAAVVITLNNAGIINKANKAVNKTNLKELEQLASVVWADEFMAGKRDDSLKSAVLDKLQEYRDNYTIIVTNEGVIVGNKGYILVRTKNEEGLIDKILVTDGKNEYEVGKSVNYMPEGVGPTDALYTGGWDVLGTDERGRIMLVSSNPVVESFKFNSPDEAIVGGVAILNNAVKDYKDGTVGVEVRSIKTEDINALTEYDPRTFVGEDWLDALVSFAASANGSFDEEAGSQLREAFGTEYGMDIMNNGLKVTYSWNGTEYPSFSYTINGETKTGTLNQKHETFRYFDEKTQEIIEVEREESGDIATITNNIYSYYAGEYISSTSDVYLRIFGDMTNTPRTYWLATPYTGGSGLGIAMGLNLMAGGFVAGVSQDSSSGLQVPPNVPIVAVVTLSEDYMLKESIITPGTYDIVEK